MKIAAVKISAILTSAIIIVASAGRVSYSENSMCMNLFFFLPLPCVHRLWLRQLCYTARRYMDNFSGRHYIKFIRL